MSQPVELNVAYVWDCDACGRENFVRAVVVEMTEEDQVEQCVQYGGEPADWETGQWMTRPEEVTCQHCGATFPTTEPEAPEDEPDAAPS